MYNEVKQADTWKPSIIRFDLDFVFRATDYQESNQTPNCPTLSKPLTIWQQMRHMDRKYQAISVTILLLILASVITAISLSMAIQSKY